MMRKSNNRIKVWLIGIILLLGVFGYLYYARQSALAPSWNFLAKNPQYLLFSKEKNLQNIYRYNLADKNSENFVTLLDGEELISLSSVLGDKKSTVLTKTSKNYKVHILNLESGEFEQSFDLDLTKVYKVYKLQGEPEQFVVLSNKDQKWQISLYDANLKPLASYEHAKEITAINPATINGNITIADFDGSKSDIHTLNIADKKIESNFSLDGKVYQLDNYRALFAKKITMADPNENDPSGNTWWKVAVYFLKDKSETLISEGNFDQNAITDTNFKYFAFNKMIDEQDQSDERIFIRASDDGSDKLEKGLPLILY